VITPNLFGFQAAQNTFGTGRPYVNGAREQENNFILDGMDNNQPDNNDVGFVPAPDAVEEFNLFTGAPRGLRELSGWRGKCNRQIGHEQFPRLTL